MFYNLLDTQLGTAIPRERTETGECSGRRMHHSGSVSSRGDEAPDKVLILDAHKNSSVLISRALSEANVEITVGGWSRLSPGMVSRYTTNRFLHSSPYQQPEQFVNELEAYLESNNFLAVIPVTDLSHVLLSKHKQRLEKTGTAIGVEDWSQFISANNKKSLAKLTESLSVPGPYTKAPESIDSVPEMRDDFSYPVVIKPQFTTVKGADGTYTEARISEENYVQKPEELAGKYRSLVETYPYFSADLPIIQEVIQGTVVATCGLAEDGSFVQYFQEERLRTYPLEGGPSSLRQGIRVPTMLEYTKEIVAALGWTGPIYVEFIRSPDGECHVLEVNGRYWGSVGCAICGGVNVPLLHYQQLKGTLSNPPQEYTVGRQQRRLFYTDLKWLKAHLEAGNIGALSPFLKSFIQADHDLMAIDDPLPVAGAVLWAIQETIGNSKQTNPLADRLHELLTKTTGSIEVGQ